MGAWRAKVGGGAPSGRVIATCRPLHPSASGFHLSACNLFVLSDGHASRARSRAHHPPERKQDSPDLIHIIQQAIRNPGIETLEIAREDKMVLELSG